MLVIPVILGLPLNAHGHIVSETDALKLSLSPDMNFDESRSGVIKIRNATQLVRISQINDSFMFDPIVISFQLFNFTNNANRSIISNQGKLSIELIVTYYVRENGSHVEYVNETFGLFQRDSEHVDFSQVIDPSLQFPITRGLLDNSTILELVRSDPLYRINLAFHLRFSHKSLGLSIDPDTDIQLHSRIQSLRFPSIPLSSFHDKISGQLSSFPVVLRMKTNDLFNSYRVQIPIPLDLTSNFMRNILASHNLTTKPKMKIIFTLGVNYLEGSFEERPLRLTMSHNQTQLRDNQISNSTYEYTHEYTPGQDQVLQFDLVNYGNSIEIFVLSVMIEIPPLFFEPSNNALELIWMWIVAYKYFAIFLSVTILAAADRENQRRAYELEAERVEEEYLLTKKRNSLFIDDSAVPLRPSETVPVVGDYDKDGTKSVDGATGDKTKEVGEVEDGLEKDGSEALTKSADGSNNPGSLDDHPQNVLIDQSTADVEDDEIKDVRIDQSAEFQFPSSNPQYQDQITYQPSTDAKDYYFHDGDADVDNELHEDGPLNDGLHREDFENNESSEDFDNLQEPIINPPSDIFEPPQPEYEEDSWSEIEEHENYLENERIAEGTHENEYQNHLETVRDDRSSKSYEVDSQFDEDDQSNRSIEFDTSNATELQDRTSRELKEDRHFAARNSSIEDYGTISELEISPHERFASDIPENYQPDQQKRIVGYKAKTLAIGNSELDDIIEKEIGETQFSWDDLAGAKQNSDFSWTDPQGKHIPEPNITDLAWELMFEGLSLDAIWKITSIEKWYLYHLLSNMMRLNELINSSIGSRLVPANMAYVKPAVQIKILRKLRESLKAEGIFDEEKIGHIVATARDMLRLHNLVAEIDDESIKLIRMGLSQDNAEEVPEIIVDREEVKPDTQQKIGSSVNTKGFASFLSFEKLYAQDPKEVLRYVNKVIMDKEYLGLNVDKDLELKTLLEVETHVAGSFHRDILYDIEGKPNDPGHVYELLARLNYYRRNDVIDTKVSKFELNGIRKVYGFAFDPESFDSLEFYYDDPESWLKIDAADNGYNLHPEIKDQLKKLVDPKSGLVRKGKEKQYSNFLFELRAEALDDYFVTLEGELVRVLDPVHDRKLIEKLFGKGYQLGEKNPKNYSVKPKRTNKSGSVFGDSRNKFLNSKFMNSKFLSEQSLKKLLPNFTELEDALCAVQRHKEIIKEYYKVHGVGENNVDNLLANFEKDSLIIFEGQHGFDHLITYRIPSIDEEGINVEQGPIIFAPGESKSGIDNTSIDTRFIGRTNSAPAGGPLDDWTKVKRFPDFLMLIASKKPSSTNNELVEYAEEYHMRLKKSFRSVMLTGKVNDLVAEIFDGKHSPAGIIYQSNNGKTIVKQINMNTLHEIISNPGKTKLPRNIRNLEIPTLNNKGSISSNDEFLQVFNPEKNKFRIYPQELYWIKNNLWTSNYEIYKKQFNEIHSPRSILKSSIDELSSADKLPDTILLDSPVTYSVKVVDNKKDVTKNLTVRILRVDLNLKSDTAAKKVVNLIDEYEGYVQLVEEHLRDKGDDAIVLLHLGRLTKNIYHDAAASLSRRLRSLKRNSQKSNEWVLDFISEGKKYQLKIKFPKQFAFLNNKSGDNAVKRTAAVQKLLMNLAGDVENDYYFFGAYRNGENITDAPILNRLAMKGSNIQPRNTINTFWSARGENKTKVSRWLKKHQKDPVIKSQFLVQTDKGVKFDLISLRVFLEDLKYKFNYLDDELINYFVEVFDLSVKTKKDGSRDRAADLVQWFKKFVTSEGRKYSLPAKYQTEDGSKIIRLNDFLDMELRKRDSDEIRKHLENWFKHNPYKPNNRRKFYPVSSDASRSYKKGELYDYAKSFVNLIDPQKIIDIQQFRSRLSDDSLEKFKEKNNEIVDEVWEKLEPIFKEILKQITGGNKLK